MKTTKISIRNEHGEYSVEVNKTGMPLSELLEEVIEPALLAAGYSQNAIDECMGGVSETLWPDSCLVGGTDEVSDH
jgi:hypothetical protein